MDLQADYILLLINLDFYVNMSSIHRRLVIKFSTIQFEFENSARD